MRGAPNGIHLEGVTLIGAVGTLLTTTVPVGSRVAVHGWTDSAELELYLDGVRIPFVAGLARTDVAAPAHGFASLLPSRLLTAGRHRVEASAGGVRDAAEFDVAPLRAAAPHSGRIDDVRIGDATFIRADSARFDLPLGDPLLVEGWTIPAATPHHPWFIMRVGELDIVGDVSFDRPDVAAAHAAVPLRCGFGCNVPPDALRLGLQDVVLAIPQTDKDWIVTDGIGFRGVAHGGLPVLVRLMPDRHSHSAAHAVSEPDAEVLFAVDGIPVGGYRSAVEPGVFRVEPRYAAHEGLLAVEIGARPGEERRTGLVRAG